MTRNKAPQNEIESTLEALTHTVLYEGYSLYPYYQTAAKNTKPIPFGVVYPQAYQKYHPEVHAATQTTCVLKGTEKTEVEISIRFLQLRVEKLFKVDFEGWGEEQFKQVDLLKVGNKTRSSGWAAVERQINLGNYFLSDLEEEKLEREICFDSEQNSNLIYDKQGKIAGNKIIRQSGLQGTLRVSAEAVYAENKGFRITVEIANATSVKDPANLSRGEVAECSFLSTHTILKATKGTFVSQINPPSDWLEIIRHCRNINTWPVLVDADDTVMLSSPIVLYDYPQIAPESTGDLFDGTEIEEALMLHLASLSDQEKQRINENDEKMKAMLEKAERITPEELMQLRGKFKEAETNRKKQQKGRSHS